MSCYVMVFKKGDKKFFDSRPLAGVESVEEAKIRTEGLYRLQAKEKGLKIGDVESVYKYVCGAGPVVSDFSKVVENGFEVVEAIPTFNQWKNKNAQAGGKKTAKKTAAKKPVAKKPAAKKVVKKTK